MPESLIRPLTPLERAFVVFIVLGLAVLTGLWVYGPNAPSVSRLA